MTYGFFLVGHFYLVTLSVPFCEPRLDFYEKSSSSLNNSWNDHDDFKEGWLVVCAVGPVAQSG